MAAGAEWQQVPGGSRCRVAAGAGVRLDAALRGGSNPVRRAQSGGPNRIRPGDRAKNLAYPRADLRDRVLTRRPAPVLQPGRIPVAAAEPWLQLRLSLLCEPKPGRTHRTGCAPGLWPGRGGSGNGAGSGGRRWGRRATPGPEGDARSGRRRQVRKATPGPEGDARSGRRRQVRKATPGPEGERPDAPGRKAGPGLEATPGPEGDAGAGRATPAYRAEGGRRRGRKATPGPEAGGG